MKPSAGFAVLSLLLAIATTVVGSSVHDATLQQRHHPGKHHVSTGAKTETLSHNAHLHGHHASAVKLEQLSHNLPSMNPNPVPPTHGTVKPGNPGQYDPIGMTCLFHWALIDHCEILTTVILCAAEVTTTSGPNGHIDWLNCGANDQGWSPAPIKLSSRSLLSSHWRTQDIPHLLHAAMRSLPLSLSLRTNMTVRVLQIFDLRIFLLILGD
jgi:hypothetical protein